MGKVIDASDKPTVAVLISTYNGESYLSELLASVLGQDFGKVSLYIRDDGSNDRTLDLLRQFVMVTKNVTLIEGANIGCAASFFELLRIADADVFMFCDQDDVWKSSKVSLAVSEMSKHDMSRPLLFHSDLIVVDERLHEIAPSFMEQQGIALPEAHAFGVLAIQNCVVGCTVAINRALADLALQKRPRSLSVAMHDWWLALLAREYGLLVYSPKAEILYRQHSANVSGARSRSLWKKLRKQFSMEGIEDINRYRTKVANQASEMLRLYSDSMSSESLKVLGMLSAIRPENGVRPVLAALAGKSRFQNAYMNASIIFTAVFTLPLYFFRRRDRQCR